MPFHKRPLGFQKGAAIILSQVKEVRIVPVVLYYTLIMHGRPEAFADACFQWHRGLVRQRTLREAQHHALRLILPVQRRTRRPRRQLLQFLEDVLLGLGDRHRRGKHQFSQDWRASRQSENAQFDIRRIGEALAFECLLLVGRNGAQPAA